MAGRASRSAIVSFHTSSTWKQAMRSVPYIRLIRGIDAFTGFTCQLVLVLFIPPLIISNVIEVVMRYVFHSPTIWALDVTTMSFGALFMLGAAYTLLKGAHVRTDIFWDRMSPRTKGIIDSIAYLVLFIPTMAVLFYISWDEFLYAFELGERSSTGIWRPLIWPFRLVIPLACALLIIQGISELLKSLWAVKTGELLTEHEKIEV